jgi:hypothetical protein
MNSQDPALTVEYKPLDKRGKVQITLRISGETHTDKLDILQSRARQSLIDRTVEKFGGVDGEELERQFDRIAAEVATECDERSGDGEGSSTEKERLVQIATGPDVELFHTPGKHDAEAFATITLPESRETLAIRSRSFEQWIAQRYYKEHGDVPGTQALRDAVHLISGAALYEGAVHEVRVRLAEFEGTIWLDLGRDDGAAVQISRDAWHVVEPAHVPIRFIRRRGMQELPVPERGGRIADLRDFVNLGPDEDWHLFLAVLVAYLRPRGPYPILIVNGEQGSAKSTLCRILRLLVDPNKSALRRPPKDMRDLMIAATNSWVVGYDNLSGISQDLSDSLCSLATGGGFATRELFSDGDEKLFDASRPVLLNGIEDFAARPDLLDRAVTLSLRTIAKSKRRDEETLYKQFERVRGKVLGALLDAVVVALRELPSVTLDSPPRMADFARWVVAAEPGLGIPRGSLLAAYESNRGSANVAAIEASVIGAPIMHLMETRSHWEGTCAALLDDLVADQVDPRVVSRKEWPKSGRGMRAALARIAPNLRAVDIVVTWPERACGGKRQRILRLDRSIEARVPSDRSGLTGRDDLGHERDDRGDRDRPGDNVLPSIAKAIRDERDDRDDLFQDSVVGDQDDCSPIRSDPTELDPEQVGQRSSLSSPSSQSGLDAAEDVILEGRSRDELARGGTIGSPEAVPHVTQPSRVLTKATSRGAHSPAIVNSDQPQEDSRSEKAFSAECKIRNGATSPSTAVTPVDTCSATSMNRAQPRCIAKQQSMFDRTKEMFSATEVDDVG